MDVINIGILGMGRIGRLHAELLLYQMDRLRPKAVYDVSPQAAEIGRRMGIQVADSVDAVFDDPEIEAVAICTSTDTHPDLMIRAAQAGKAIFCEKPIAHDLGEVDRALAVIEETGVYLQIGFNRRFDPSHRAVHQAVAAGELGEVHLVRITSRDPAPPPISYVKVSGGIFLDMTIHDFDMARYVTGSEVAEVYAQGGVRVDPAIGEAGDLDTAVVVLTHENGAITTIDNSRQAVYGYDQRVEAFGSKGMAVSQNPGATTTVLWDKSGSRGATLPYFFIERYIPSYLAGWEAFAEGVLSGGPSPVNGHDGRAPLVIGKAAWKSIQEGRPIRTAQIG
ncbi:MAG: inositol 2-dehydrogenase [Acidimicrobiia bacterium]|nr:inositol 2-dehydrogenase [Acidimicrobiia bacterium]MXZ06532.1 inositol 2-dehydrogenase [Acidimicrobiia bacterium]